MRVMERTVDLEAMGRAAKAASRRLATLTTKEKNEALLAIAAGLEAGISTIVAENALDVAEGRAHGLGAALIDRLMLDEARVRALAADTRKVADLPDPVGAEIDGRLLPNGMRLSRRRIPVGVLGVIYEARPNVTIDIAVLSVKTGNAVILRGGSDTLRSSQVLVGIVRQALEQTGVPVDAVQLIASPDRAHITELLRLDAYVDMIIPRGGAALHKLCREQATVPVITGGIGVCHLFVDASADLERSLAVVENAKVQRPSVCNTIDTVLVHRAVAEEFLPMLARRLARSGVELRATPEASEVLSRDEHGAPVVAAGPDDFDQEWMALILGVRIVDDVEEAIQHIYDHGSEHSDGILTNDWQNAHAFCERHQLFGGLRQCQHTLQRRRPVWAGGRGGRQHAEAPRPRPHGPGGADDLQMGLPRRLSRTAMTDYIYYVNGEFIPASAAQIGLNDLGFVRGYGVFDVLRTYGVTPFGLRAHLERLQHSAAQIDLPLPWSLAELESIVQADAGAERRHRRHHPHRADGRTLGQLHHAGRPARAARDAGGRKTLPRDTVRRRRDAHHGGSRALHAHGEEPELHHGHHGPEAGGGRRGDRGPVLHAGRRVERMHDQQLLPVSGRSADYARGGGVAGHHPQRRARAGRRSLRGGPAPHSGTRSCAQPTSASSRAPPRR